MARGELPPLGDQLELLKRTGEQFTAEERQAACAELPGVFMESDGTPALYDARIVPHIPSMVVPDSIVCNGLERVRHELPTAQDVTTFIDKLRNTAGLIIAFSGYGTEGRDYSVESDAIETVLISSEEAGLSIDFVIGGGTGYGVPGLAGLIAKMHGYPTVGCAPLRSLRGAAPCTDFVVVGREFGHEAKALGAASDVLFVLGGGPIATDEVKSALNRGSKVISLACKTYPANSAAYLHERHARARNAHRSGQLQIFENREQLSGFLSTLNIDEMKANRGRRAEYLRRISKLVP